MKQDGSMRRLARCIGAAVGIATAASSLGFSAAFAHAGHAQGEHGFRLDGILEVAGTAAATVIAYVLATWFFRHRDRGDLAPGPAEPDPGQAPLESSRSWDR